MSGPTPVSLQCRSLLGPPVTSSKTCLNRPSGHFLLFSAFSDCAGYCHRSLPPIPPSYSVCAFGFSATPCSVPFVHFSLLNSPPLGWGCSFINKGSFIASLPYPPGAQLVRKILHQMGLESGRRKRQGLGPLHTSNLQCLGC